ncbi:MAG TPA: hydantoinase/oxoprolinase family protein [Solirubrobacteraceae bacterium]|jgi:N-methylhydantoinase A|nr:hydantoinase/oxoprolinase family protein [Solirubrobacteraceae bacterium]
MLLGVDVGGTFTDAALVDAGGYISTAKVPSTPGAEHAAVMAAIEAVLERADAHAREVERFAHGMTVATNALLMAQAHPPARTALVATAGFVDVVELGRQARPSLYRLCEAAPAPLAPPELRFGAPERCGPDGVLRPLDDAQAQEMVARLADLAPEAVAVVLLHSYAHPEHERRLGELIARALPAAHVSLSHELVGTFREYERAATTEIDAALSPLLADYLARLGESGSRLGLPAVQVMQSSGGLTDAGRAGAHAALTVLSGPAGGVAGALLLGTATGERDLLCFDMGGTSCDVCLIDGGVVAETAEREVAGRPLALPALDIHTVGAGGGSIAWLDAGGALRVGPRSAGAEPGAACYGRGGSEPTVTDANLLLGRLLADAPLAGGVTLDLLAARRAIAGLAEAAGLDELSCAEGIVRVAETEMLRALSAMTVQRGIDPRGYTLVPFGGAGGLHAVAMAAEIGIERVLCPRAAGVLSAFGLACAAPRRDVSATAMLACEAFTRERVRAVVQGLRERAAAELGAPVASELVRYELRYAGQSFELTVRHDAGEPLDPVELRERFATEHERRYGYVDERGEVELVNVRVSALGHAPSVRLAGEASRECSRGATRVAFAGQWLDAELWSGQPPAGAHIGGPALCAMAESTLLVPPGWAGNVDESGTIALERAR